MKDSSRNQGLAICFGAVVLGVLFLVGLLQESYWAIAVPVALVTFFGLGLTFWVGWTIATIQVEPFDDGQPQSPEPAPDASPDRTA